MCVKEKLKARVNYRLIERMTEFDKFPPPLVDAIRFNCLTLPYVFCNASSAQLRRELINVGDFLVVLGERKMTLELCVRVSNSAIDVFPIDITVKNSRVCFSIGPNSFHLLSSLIDVYRAKNFTIRTTDRRTRLKTSIFRQSNQISGLFGHGRVIKIDHQEGFVRALSVSYAAHSQIRSHVSKLLAPVHENVCRVLDYELYSLGRQLPPLILLRYELCLSTLIQHFSGLKFPLSTRRYAKWALELTQAVDYLEDVGCSVRCVTLRSCMLSGNEILKLSDFWPDCDSQNNRFWLPQECQVDENVVENGPQHQDQWRWTPPEVMESGRWNNASPSWKLGALVYQIFTRGQVPIRPAFSSLSEFIRSELPADELYFLGTPVNREAYSKHVNYHASCQLVRSFKGLLPKIPESFTQIFSACMNRDIDARPGIGEIKQVVQREYSFCKTSFAVSKLLII